MCGSMADIQSATAEIRRGKKKRKKKPHGKNIMSAYATQDGHNQETLFNTLKSWRRCVSRRSLLNFDRGRWTSHLVGWYDSQSDTKIFILIFWDMSLNIGRSHEAITFLSNCYTIRRGVCVCVRVCVRVCVCAVGARRCESPSFTSSPTEKTVVWSPTGITMTLKMTLVTLAVLSVVVCRAATLRCSCVSLLPIFSSVVISMCLSFLVYSPPRLRNCSMVTFN